MAFSAFSQRRLVDKIVGIVGDEIVLLSDVELQFQQMKLEGQDVPDDMRCQLLGSLLAQKMFLQEAQNDSIFIAEEEIESELNRRIRYFISMIGSEERLEEYYGKSIIEIKDEFRGDIQEQLLSQRMQGTIFEGLSVTPKEVRDFFNSIPKDSVPYFNAEVEIQQLVITPEITDIQKDLAREKLEGIRKRTIDENADFAIQAISYSEDPGTGAQGGDLGFFGRGQMVSEFEGEAFRLKVGELSEVFESPFGFHILKVTDRKGEKVRASHILIKPKVTSFELQDANEILDSVRIMILEGKISYNNAVKVFSNDEETQNNGGMLLNPNTQASYWEIDELDKNVYFTIEQLEIGEYSKVEYFELPDGSPAFRILGLRSETQAHVANLEDDYVKIKGAAQTKKEEQALREWLDDKLEGTYVYLDKRYIACDILKDWYAQANKNLEKTYD